MDKLILHGGGEHTRVVLDCLLSQQVEVLGIFDPKYSGDLFGVKQMGAYDPNFQPSVNAIVSIGDNYLRKKASKTMQHPFTSCLHRSAIFSSRAIHGLGCMILQGSIVQANTKIGKHVIINTGAQVDHDCEIGDFVHIAPGAILCGTVKVGEGVLVGAGATVLPGKKIGKWSIVGAGSVVTQDVPDNATVIGNPARIIEYKNK